MLNFAMVPTPHGAAVTGLLAFGDVRVQLHQKLATRAIHYDALSIAIGESWTAILGDGIAPLPWIAVPPLFMYSPKAGWFCQIGYRPNVPESLHDRLAMRLRQQFSLGGSFALVTDGPDGQIYDFSAAQPLGDIDLHALAMNA